MGLPASNRGCGGLTSHGLRTPEGERPLERQHGKCKAVRCMMHLHTGADSRPRHCTSPRSRVNVPDGQTAGNGGGPSPGTALKSTETLAAVLPWFAMKTAAPPFGSGLYHACQVGTTISCHSPSLSAAIEGGLPRLIESGAAANTVPCVPAQACVKQ